MSTADVAVLANKCGTLMASNIHQIPLFTRGFMDKLMKCTSPFIFKIYLLPYMSWFDCSILIQLVNLSNKKAALKMVNQFINSLDYSKPITSYPIPGFSQLIIPLENNQYTVLATKHTTRSIRELTLPDLKKIKQSLVNRLEITHHAVQLAAVSDKSCCFYWLIPNQIRSLVEIKLNEVQLELWKEGIILTALFPVSLCLDENDLHWNIFNMNLEDPTEV